MPTNFRGRPVTSPAIILWLAEFILEAAGAVMCFKVSCGNGSRYNAGCRYPTELPAGINLLGAYLAFRALADIACFLILLHFGNDIYQWANYAQRVVQYVLFGILCVKYAAIALRADKYTHLFYSGFAVVSWALGSLYFHAVIPMSTRSLCSFESGAHLMAGAFLAIALYHGAAEKRVREISHGLLALGLSDGLIAIARHFVRGASALYPYGAIAGLVMLLWAVSRKEDEIPAGEVRLGLGFRTSLR